MASPKMLEQRARETALKLRAKGFYRAKGVGDAPDQLVLKTHVDAKWREQLKTGDAMRNAELLGDAFKRASERVKKVTHEFHPDDLDYVRALPERSIVAVDGSSGRVVRIAATGDDKAQLAEQVKAAIESGQIAVISERDLVDTTEGR